MKPRKERTVYTKEQTRLLQEHFYNSEYPHKKQLEELAALVGVTVCEIKTWFKNHRAKCKRMNLQNISNAPPETNGSSKSVFESTHDPGSTPLVAEIGKPMYSGTFGVDFIPKLNCSQESSLPQYQACDGARCSQQEALLDGHAPVTAGDSGLSASVEVQTDLAVNEAPVGLAAAAQGPEDAQGSGPSAEELWQRILEDFDKSEDWLTLRYITTPSKTSQPLEQFRPVQP